MTRHPWTNVYGVARSLLAFGTLLTLLLHSGDTLFRPLGETMPEVSSHPLLAISLFTISGASSPEVGRWIAIGILAVVVWGWRPQVTGVLHWWVSFSFALSSFVLEGGDQITANLTLLLIPITLFDGRRSHWESRPVLEETTRARILALVGTSAWLVIRLQVAVLYFHAAVGKMGVDEWMNGTAIYYWAIHPVFGAPDWLRGILYPLLTNAAGVTIVTWSVIVLELLLFTGLVMQRSYRGYLLAAGLLFHFGIILLHGLVSFFFAMAAALILYLRPPESEFSLLRPWPWPVRPGTPAVVAERARARVGEIAGGGAGQPEMAP